MATSVAVRCKEELRQGRQEGILAWLKSEKPNHRFETGDAQRSQSQRGGEVCPNHCSGSGDAQRSQNQNSGELYNSNLVVSQDPIEPIAHDIKDDMKPGQKEGFECDIVDNGKKNRNVVMTLNNYTDAEVEALRMFGKKNCTYLIFGYEIAPTTGTKHLQIYAEFSEAKTINTIKTQCFSRRYYISRRRGTAKQASDYCMYEDYPICKKENRFEVFGDISKQGQRAEFDEVLAYAKVHTRQETIREFPYMFARMWHGLNSIIDACESEYIPEPFAELRKWQQSLFLDLKKPADDRTIVWVEDTKGGSGKSTLCTKYLIPQLGFLPLEGRLQDMAHIYNGEPGVIFDLARGQTQYVEHLMVFAEKLKNGCLVSSKYNGKVKRFRPPHVVFFSNEPPPSGQWTKDRLRHIVLDGSQSNV